MDEPTVEEILEERLESTKPIVIRDYSTTGQHDFYLKGLASTILDDIRSGRYDSPGLLKTRVAHMTERENELILTI